MSLSYREHYNGFEFNLPGALELSAALSYREGVCALTSALQRGSPENTAAAGVFLQAVTRMP